MRFIKKFVKFLEGGPAPSPSPSPSTRPGIAPSPARPKTEPGTKPGRRQRPSPIRRDKPGVEPAPKAELPTATEEDVAKRFIDMLDENGDDIKNYIKE